MDSKVGAFFIHGFLGYPTDFGNLSVALQKLKFDTQMIILPGHGVGENIVKYSWKDWLDYSVERYLEYKDKFDVVYLIGFSMGGAIATYLAGKYGCDKLVLVAPAFEFVNPLQNVRHVRDKLRRRLIGARRLNTLMEQEIDFKEGEEKKPKLKSYLDFVKTVRYCTKNITTIEVPARIYHGENDEVIPYSSSLNIFRRFAHPDRKIEIIPYGKHMLLKGASAKLVELSIIEYLSQVPVKEPVT